MNVFTFPLTLPTIVQGRYQRISYGMLLASLLVFTGCGKSSDNKAIKNEEVKSVEKEVPMSAAPAKTKDAPIAVTDDTPAKVAMPTASSAAEGTIIEPPAPKEGMIAEKVARGKTKKASAVGETVASNQEAADNSAMESISENDQVIDDAPASPNAPQAKESGEKSAVKNEPVHKTK